MISLSTIEIVPIVSISLNENIIQELDKLQEILGFSGKIRNCKGKCKEFTFGRKKNRWLGMGFFIPFF